MYTLEDLKGWERPGVWLAVVGHPVRHSISPQMHNAALGQILRRHPEYANWRYVRFEIPAKHFGEALPVFHQKRFFGLNLTIPHKVQALDLASAIDPEAALMGAVNTLVRDESGYRGYNTDGYGLRSGVYTDLGTRLQDADVVLLGAGGAARAAAIQCLHDGCRRLWIGNRSRDRLDGLLALLKRAYPEAAVSGFDLADPPGGMPESCLVINATSLGLKADDPAPIDPARFRGATSVYDMIYNPVETRLLAEARALGLRAANGLSMLVFQGARSLEIWTQQSVSVAAMETAARSALKIQST